MIINREKITFNSPSLFCLPGMSKSMLIQRGSIKLNKSILYKASLEGIYE